VSRSMSASIGASRPSSFLRMASFMQLMVSEHGTMAHARRGSCAEVVNHHAS
jgi:hypothetical protein